MSNRNQVSTGFSAPLTLTKENRRDVLFLGAAAFLLYAINVDYTLFGDAAMYADYVVLHKFDELTLHFGYFVILSAANSTLGSLLGIPIQEVEVWLNVAAGTLAVCVSYLFAYQLFGRRRDALICAIIFGLSGRVLSNATTSEMYMLQTLFVLASFYLFVTERIILAGILSAIAMLVSPLSAFAYLFFPAYDYLRHRRFRFAVLARLALSGLVIYVPFLVIDGREMLFGVRGLIKIKSEYALQPTTWLRNFPLYQFKAFSFLLVLIVPALMAARANARLWLLALAVAIPHIFIIMQLPTEDHVFILNTDFFCSCLLVVGWRKLEELRLGQWVGPAVLGSHVGLFVLAGVIHSYQPHRDYAREMQRIAKTYLVDRNAIMIADWGRAVALTFYGRPSPTTTLLREPLFRNQIYDIEDAEGPARLFTNGREVYLLDSWEPTPLNRFLRSKASLAEFERKHSLVLNAEHRLHIQCTQIEGGVHRVYRCVPGSA